MALHTIVEHDTTHIKPYIDAKISSVKQALSDEAEARAKLGAHNLFDFEGWLNEKGVTYTKSGNSYTFTVGANTGNNNAYKFSSTPITVDLSSTITAGTALNVGFRFIKNGEVVSQKITNGTIEADSIYIDYSAAGTATFTDVMLKLHTDSYSGFTPYVPTNAELLSADVNAELGAHQLLPLNLAKIKSINTNGSWSGNVYTYNGIDYTISTDSDGNITNINVNGTSSGNSWLRLQVDAYATPSVLGIKLNVLYFIGGAPKNSNAQFKYDSGGAWSYPTDTGDGAVFTWTNASQTFSPMIYVGNARTISNESFKPLLCLASDPSRVFTPYAMTNQQLTGKVIVESFDSVVTPTESRITISSQKLYKQGNICTLVINFTSNINDANALLGRISIIPKDGNKFIGYCVDTSDKSTHLVYVSSAYGYFGGYGVLTSGHTFEASITYISEN